jgi:D-amino peptidase
LISIYPDLGHLDDVNFRPQEGMSMKVFISADMEGISGVVASTHVDSQQAEYQRFRKLMTADVNAAIRGALAGGATLVVVNDAHGDMRNILIEELHPDAQLIAGSPKPLSMMQGIEEGFEAAFFIGYHACAGSPYAILDHTWSGIVYGVRVNDQPMGELGLNAGLAGWFKVPVVLVTGDMALADEAHALLTDAEVIAVKQGVGRSAAKCLPPAVSQARIEQAAQRALRGRKVPLIISPPLTLTVDFTRTAHADMAELIPGSRRIGGRRVEYKSGDWVEMYRVWRGMVSLASTVER